MSKAIIQQNEELAFWKQYYVAGLHKNPHDQDAARMAADRGVNDLRKKLAGIPQSPDDCISAVPASSTGVNPNSGKTLTV